jgi:ribosomal protein S18 acetylase RimI-like enzyme
VNKLEQSDLQVGLRPINLRTDLGQLADLIELVFADSIDESGRSAIREMRYLSRLGPGLNFLSQVNELALGVSLGYVWVEDGRLIGNASIYPANWPKDMGKAWIIANVGVHPDYQRRGIATHLMRASMNLIRRRGGQHAILQVDADNTGAKKLYENLGFFTERTWTTWRRYYHRPPPTYDRGNIFITRRPPHEWKAEYALAQRVRPQARGGLGWLKPLHPSYFREPVFKRIVNFFTLGSTERLIIRSPDRQHIHASLWIERQGLTSLSTYLTLMVDRDYQGVYDEVLLHAAVTRFYNASLLIEHPTDAHAANDILRRYRFQPRRTVTHMRWDVDGE